MSILHIGISAAAIVLALSAFNPVAAQTNEGNEPSSTGPESDGSSDLPLGQRRGTETNTSIITSLNTAAGFCNIGAYAIDCLSERLGVLAQQMEGQKEFNDVRKILKDASRKLNSVARQNLSTTLAPARFATKEAKPVTTSRRLLPVAEDRQAAAISQAIAIIDEAQTLLLRSAGGTNDRTIQYQRISAALGSNKVLLRSL